MYVRVDTGQTPPAVELCEPDDFGSFKAVVAVPAHLWLDPAGLAALAGRGDDPAWQEQLAGMIAYAGKKGWLDERGWVRAHVEIERAGTAEE